MVFMLVFWAWNIWMGNKNVTRCKTWWRKTKLIFICQALDWLQENIAEFGGDPGSVTLMGHGTGAACVTFLMTSPAVLDGEFHYFHEFYD